MASYEIQALGQLTRPTTVQMLPTILQGVLRSHLTKRYDFSAVERITGAHGGLKKSEEEELFGKGKWQSLHMYGLTEASPWVAVQRVSEKLTTGHIGHLLPGIEARLITEDGVDAPKGGPGELWSKGPNVTAGYIDNEQANKTAFPEQGWFNTGGICAISGDEIVSLTEQTKELIKHSSFQVSHNELDVYLVRHLAVRDGAVGPTLDKIRDTNLPIAYVMLDEKLKDTWSKLEALKDIQREVDGQISRYKRLRGGAWEVTEIPRNATSKVLRKNLSSYTTGLCSRPAVSHPTKL